MKTFTREEIYEKAAREWKSFTSWNLTYDEFITASYVKGADGTCDNSGDVVYTSPDGYSLSRAMCNSWINHYHAYLNGFYTAYLGLGLTKED